MQHPNPPIQPRDASGVNDDNKPDLLGGFRRFFAEITTEGLGSPPPTCESNSLPPAPLGPPKSQKTETGEPGTSLVEASESSQPELEIGNSAKGAEERP